jgi:hypothetical protein
VSLSNTIETLLIFVGIPATVIAVIYGLVYATSTGRGRRYRPGRPFDFRPVWLLSAPEQVDQSASAQRAALRGADTPVALPSAAVRGGERGDWPPADPAEQAVTGGASDRW